MGSSGLKVPTPLHCNGKLHSLLYESPNYLQIKMKKEAQYGITILESVMEFCSVVYRSS